MSNSQQYIAKLFAASPLGMLLLSAALVSSSGCAPAQSVYHDGNFSEEQKAGAQAEYQTVEDEESQGSNKKKKKSAKK